MKDRSVWQENGRVFITDQTLLPNELKTVELQTVTEMWEAIKSLRVRGAPAIGVGAAYGVWLAVRHRTDRESLPLAKAILNACDYLATARPTAENLFWALNRFRRLAEAGQSMGHDDLKAAVLAEANAMLEEDNEVCRALGRVGSVLLKDGDTVLTHCHAGGLATAQFGTALSVVTHAFLEEKKNISVIADETRPLLQGARLTAWEMMRNGIPVTLICDNMAATVMQRGMVQCVIVGTDRVAANGDVANKIGTYGVAVLAKEHGIPFYVAAPTSSIDMRCATGRDIPIEERAAEEITNWGERRIAPKGVKVFNPAFDVTPNTYVTGIVTEYGLVRAPLQEGIAEVMAAKAAGAPML